MNGGFRVSAGVGILIVGLVLAACSGGTPTELQTVPPVESAAPSSPAPEPSASGTPLADAEPTCETIIPEATAKDFAAIGWTAQVDAFRIGATEVPDGLQCTWGDYSVPTDHVQIFGWAPIEPDLAESAQAKLISDGWTREDESEGIYITESRTTAIATDENGYGFTYLFGPGWVKIADTKQGLLLVEWPPAS